MKGAADFSSPGEIDLAAFMAGNDILLISENVPRAHQLIIQAYREQRISEERLQRSVKKILQAKYKTGLANYQPVKEERIVEELNSPADRILLEKAVAHSLTVVSNKDVIPIKKLDGRRFAYVELGDDSGDAFFQHLLP